MGASNKELEKMVNYEIVRTLAIVKEMAEGKRIKVDEYTIAMGVDMTIGFLSKGEDGQEFINGLSTLDLCQLNTLLNKHNIGVSMPEIKD